MSEDLHNSDNLAPTPRTELLAVRARTLHPDMSVVVVNDMRAIERELAAAQADKARLITALQSIEKYWNGDAESARDSADEMQWIAYKALEVLADEQKPTTQPK